MSQAAYIKKVRVAKTWSHPPHGKTFSQPGYTAAEGYVDPGASDQSQIGTVFGLFQDVPTDSPSLNFGVELIDDTELKSNDGYRSRLYGLHDWSVSADSMFESDDEALAILKDALFNRRNIMVQYLPTGVADNTGLQGTCKIENFNFGGAVSGDEKIGVSLQASGALAPSA